MLIAIIGLCIVFFLIGWYYYAKKTCHDVGCILTMCACAIVGVVCIVIACVLTVCVVTQPAIVRQKISLYEKQNAQINQYVSSVVEGYQRNEEETYGGFRVSTEGKDALTLITTYPQLQSDTLVAKQIDIYLENQREIISLRDDLIDIGVKRWCLYFGSIVE